MTRVPKPTSTVCRSNYRLLRSAMKCSVSAQLASSEPTILRIYLFALLNSTDTALPVEARVNKAPKIHLAALKKTMIASKPWMRSAESGTLSLSASWMFRSFACEI